MRRFYQQVSVQGGDGAWQATLDGRGIQTQGGTAQVVPSEKLANMLAEEWRAQGDEIDTKSFIYRDMADYALDVVAPGRADAIANLVTFSDTDTLCYRADPGDGVFARQGELWDPLVTACEARYAVRFTRVSGIIHDPQPAELTENLLKALSTQDDFQLAGLQTLTALAASLIIGLAGLDDAADAAALFKAANLEEDYQAELWGWDEEAQKVRSLRALAFARAVDFVQAARR